MPNTLGTIVARPPGPAVAAVEGGATTSTDSSLPDPTKYARQVLLALIMAAAVVAVGMNAAGWTNNAFEPSASTTANFGLFAGFYVAAQVLERLMQLVVPMLPPLPLPASIIDETVKAAQIKADRANVTLGVAAVLGVAASNAFGLFFLAAIGMDVSHTVDSFLTGITIAAGTKPLHDFITLIQNKNAPNTGTGTST